MYELMNVLVSEFDIIKKNGNTYAVIDEYTAERKWCAVDEEFGIAIDILTREVYPYLSTMSGIYTLKEYSIKLEEKYAMFGTTNLVTPTPEIKEKYSTISKIKRIK